METNQNASAAAQPQPISITRFFKLPLDTVWKAFTDPNLMKNWWGPRDFTCPVCKIDLRTGGNYLYCMRGPDGKETWGTGTYKEIVPQKKLVLTDSFSDPQGNIINASEAGMKGNWPREMLITLEFSKTNDDRTSLHLKHEGIPAEMFDDCIKGWEESFDKLEENVK
jgi:uncharacterized protein YndB with AHSA1/START domain